MPEELKPSDNPHQININYSGKRYLAFAFLIFRVQFFKEFVETEGRKKTKELIEEASLTQAVDFGDIFSCGQICGNARLVPLGSVPSESVGNVL